MKILRESQKSQIFSERKTGNRVLWAILCSTLGIMTGLHALDAHADCLLAQSTLVRIELTPCTTPTSSQSRAGAELLRFIGADIIREISPAVRALLGDEPLLIQIRQFTAADRKSAESWDGLFRAGRSESGESIPSRIELRGDLLSSTDLNAVVAHEYFHYVHFLVHPSEHAWIREGLAQVFESRVLGHLPGRYVAEAFRNPETALISPRNPELIDIPSYGHAFLYFYYLYSHCGGNELFWDLARGTPDVFGPTGIDKSLSKMAIKVANPPEVCTNFRTSAAAFEVARVHNRRDPHTGDDRYALVSTTIKVPTRKVSPLTTDLENLLPYFPLVLAPEVKVAPRTDLQFYWLQQTYPYAVLREKPLRAENFRLLVFKELSL